MENLNENEYEWISVSELAVRLGVTKQTAYNKVNAGEFPVKEFKRGSMRGLLAGFPKK